MIAAFLERRDLTTRLAAYESGDRAFLLAIGGTLLVLVQFAPGPIRVIFGFILAFTIPGLAVLSVAFREQSDTTAHLRGAHRFGLVVMLSISSHIALALGVYALGFTMSRMTVMISLPILIFASALHAILPTLRGNAMVTEDDVIDYEPAGALVPDNDHAAYLASAQQGRRWASRWPSVAGLILASAVGAMAIIVGLKVLPEPEGTTFATLSLSGPWSAIDHATAVDRNGDVAIQVVLTNNSFNTETYSLIASAGDNTWRPRTFTLAGGGHWEGVVAGHVGVNECLTKIQIGVTGVPKDPTKAETDPSKTVSPLIVWAGPQNELPCAGPFSKEQAVIKFKPQDASGTTSTTTSESTQGAQG